VHFLLQMMSFQEKFRILFILTLLMVLSQVEILIIFMSSLMRIILISTGNIIILQTAIFIYMETWIWLKSLIISIKTISRSLIILKLILRLQRRKDFLLLRRSESLIQSLSLTASQRTHIFLTTAA